MKGMLKAILTLAAVSSAAVPAAAQAAPQPSPEHQRLGYFVGRWKAEGEIIREGHILSVADTTNWCVAERNESTNVI